MKEFTSHIDYLIQKHDCVIIPDFGGFVLNREVAATASDGSMTPPRVSVGFNPELKYNDGLLAESYMNAYSISYDAACKRLTDVVKRLNTVLSLKQPLQIGQLGKLSLDTENRLIFEPNNNLSAFHPETFGLSVLDIKRLVDIEEIQKISITANRHSVYKRMFAGIGAAAAAILVFFVTSTPISENENLQIQKSGFFADLISTSATLSSSNAETMPAVDILAAEPSAEAKKEEFGAENKTILAATKTVEPATKTETPIVKEEPKGKFFVIIASAGGKSEAKRVLKKFQEQGYKNADIIDSRDRSRIYIASFADRSQAESYLASFKKNNPKLNDAWVFTRN